MIHLHFFRSTAFGPHKQASFGFPISRREPYAHADENCDEEPVVGERLCWRLPVGYDRPWEFLTSSVRTPG